MNSKIANARISMYISYWQEYTCSRCGAKDVGTVQYINDEAGSIEDARATLNKLEQKELDPTCFPLFWDRDGGGFICPLCRRELDK